MGHNSESKSIQGCKMLMKCSHCGGRLLYQWGEFRCLLCSREHDSKGVLIEPAIREGRVYPGGSHIGNKRDKPQSEEV